MSVYYNNRLNEVVKDTCRELRKKSTPAEQRLWNYLRNRLLLNRKFYRQYPICYETDNKDSFYVADFFCFDEKLIIELDGEIHKYTAVEDVERTKILNKLGYNVIRFSNDEIFGNINKVLNKIEMNFVINQTL